jgi:AraC-like DNA-binding protein
MVSVVGQLSVRHYGASHGSHDHPHFQVLLGLGGALALEVDGRGQRIGAGEGVVIAPGARHDFEAHGGARCLVLDTHHEGWEPAVGRPAPTSDLLPLAHYLAQATEAGRPQARLLGPTLLLEAWLPAKPAASRSPRPRRAIDWVTLARWAQAHPTPPEVQQLAAQAHLSSAQFAARCQQELGLSPMQWQRRQRLAQARHWLDEGLSVAETARRSGYRSPSALTAALRREQI